MLTKGAVSQISLVQCETQVFFKSDGCETCDTRNCTMCTHKYAYGAPQYMNVDKGVLKTKKLIEATGNTDVMLMTNCYADYPGFPDIIYKLK